MVFPLYLQCGQLLTGTTLLASQVVNSIMEGRRLAMPAPGQLPGGSKQTPGLEEYMQLVQRCWAQDPEDRPSFRDIVAELRCGQQVGAACCAAQPEHRVESGAVLRDPWQPWHGCASKHVYRTQAPCDHFAM